MGLNKDLKTIYLFAILCSILLFLVYGVREYSDTYSYLKAWDSISNWKIDIFRTPVYPIFLGICKTIFGPGSFKLVAIVIQHLLFLLSIAYFYRLALAVLSNEKLCFWISFVYATIPCINSWGNCILTESFAISGMVFLLYYSMKLYRECSYASALGFFLWLAFLVFLRPSFLYLLPVFLVFWLICLFGNGSKCSVAGMVCTLLVAGCQLFYIHQFNREYGVFTPSSVSVLNQFFMARQGGLLCVEGVENESLKLEIIKSVEEHGIATDDRQFLWAETNHMMESYPLKDIQQAVSVSLKSRPLSALKMMLVRASRSASLPLFFTFMPGLSALLGTIGVSLNFLYLFLIAYTLIIAYWIIKNRQFPWFTLLMYSLAVSNLITVIIGAQAEWSRLLLPSMPIILLMFGQVCRVINIHPLSILP